MDNNIFTSTQTMDLSALDAVFNADPAPDVLQSKGQSNVLLNPSLEKVLDQADPDKKPEEKAPEQQAVVTEKGVLDVLDNVDRELTPPEEATDTTTETQETAEQKAGRPKTDKNALVTFLKSKIDTQEFGVPDDYDTKIPVEEYLTKLPEKDLFNILDTNWKVKETEIRNTAPLEFYEALPEEAKMVAQYAAIDAPKDWKGFFASLAATEQIRTLDPANEEHHVPIVKTYLQATTQMTPTQIDEQVEDWKENGKLDKKAQEFKVPLDAIQKQQSEVYLIQAQKEEQYQADLANFYATQVRETLKNNELAGIKLDKKFAKELEYNMLSVAPGPYTGNPVNYFGYGMEKCQYGTADTPPDYEALALAAWIMNDKKAALESLGQRGANEATDKAVKLIKLNQGIAAGTQAPAPAEQKPVKRLPNNSNVLRRTA